MTASTEENHLPLQPCGISAASSFSDVSSDGGKSTQTYYTQQYNVLSFEGHLPENVANLAHGFPLSVTSSMLNPQEPVTLSTLISHFLPQPDEAKRLVQLYLQQAPWFFGAVTEKQIEEEVMPMWYGVASSNGLSPTVTISNPRTGTSHDLALLFMIFCFGSLTDMDLPSPPENPISDKFYQLGKAALTLDPNAPAGNDHDLTAHFILLTLRCIDSWSTKSGILDRPPSVATVQTLSLMAIYEGLRGGENSIESTWLLFGLATKLAQSVRFFLHTGKMCEAHYSLDRFT